MTEEIINKDELKKMRVLLESGQRLAISTKEFERVFDKIDSLKQENEQLKKEIASQKGLITVGGKQQYQYSQRIDELEQENNSLQAQLNNITVQSNNVITALEQENKELQAYKDINEDFKKAWDELNEKYKQLRSALEEIRILATKNVSIENFVKIQNKINEVLQ